MNPPSPSPTDPPSKPGSGKEYIEQARRKIRNGEPLINLEDRKAEDLNLPPRSSVPTRLENGPNTNVSRTPYILKFLAIIFVANSLLFFVCSWWYYRQTKSEFTTKIAEFMHHDRSESGSESPNQNESKSPHKKLEELESAFSARIDELQKQLADARKKNPSADELAEQNARRIADLAAQISESKTAPVIQNASSPASPASELSPTQSELILLKERNRLTAYADEAIATGARGPYERLWDSLTDSRLANLSHATRSEILRVQDCFLSGQRVKYYGIQQYQIPVADIFPDSAALAPAQLSDDQMIQILQNQKLAWQSRVKAAWYLGQRRTTKTAEALVKSIKEDPALDVVAEATFSFEQVTGYHARLFEVQPLLVWWANYNKTAPLDGKAKEKPEAPAQNTAP